MLTNDIRSMIRETSNQELLLLDTLLTQELVGECAYQDVEEYVATCLTKKGYEASGVSMLGYSGVKTNTLNSNWAIIAPFHYITIGLDIGGNAIVLDALSAEVFYANHESFAAADADGSIWCPSAFQGYKNLETWYTIYGLSRNNISKGMLLLEKDFSSFMKRCLKGLLTKDLDFLC